MKWRSSIVPLPTGTTSTAESTDDLTNTPRSSHPNGTSYCITTLGPTDHNLDLLIVARRHDVDAVFRIVEPPPIWDPTGALA